MVGQDGEVGGEVRGGGRERRLARGEGEEAEELRRAGAADGERLHDELPAEAEALHVGGELEGEFGGGGGFGGLVVGVLVFLLLVFVLGFCFHGAAAAVGVVGGGVRCVGVMSVMVDERLAINCADGITFI